MISIPRLQTAAFGVSLKIGTLTILYTILVVSFFGLVYRTSLQVEKDKVNQTGGELNFRYIVNTVISICGFLATPLALYATHHERYYFFVPYLVLHATGTISLAIDVLADFIALIDSSSEVSVAGFLVLLLLTGFFAYSFLIIYCYFLQLKEQREEIK